MPEIKSGEISFYEFTSKVLQIAKGGAVFGIWNPPGETEIEFGDYFMIETNAPSSPYQEVKIKDSVFLDFGNPQWDLKKEIDIGREL